MANSFGGGDLSDMLKELSGIPSMGGGMPMPTAIKTSISEMMPPVSLTNPLLGGGVRGLNAYNSGGGFGGNTGGNPFGGGGGGKPGISVSGGNLVSPTIDPTFQGLMKEILKEIPQPGSQPSLESIVSQGAQSPLLQAVLGPAMQGLVAPQAMQRQQLTDITRAAGGLRGSTYGGNMTQLIGQQGLESNDLMSKIIAQTLGTLVPAQLQENRQAFDPANALMQLLGLVKPSLVTDHSGGAGQPTGWENIPQSQGLNTPMYNDTLGAAKGGYVSAGPPQQGGNLTPSWNANLQSDPLINYLLGGGSGSSGGGIYQNGPNSWSSAPGVIDDGWY